MFADRGGFNSETVVSSPSISPNQLSDLSNQCLEIHPSKSGLSSSSRCFQIAISPQEETDESTNSPGFAKVTSWRSQFAFQPFRYPPRRTISCQLKFLEFEERMSPNEDPSAMVIGRSSYAVSKADGDHTLIASDIVIESNVVFGSRKIDAPVLFRGIGHSLSPENSLVFKVLSASPSAYSANPKSTLSKPPSLVGSSISLVSVMQPRI